MKLQIVKASTSQIITVFIQDSSSTTGAGLGSLDQTSSIIGGYVRTGETGLALAVDENVTTEGTYEAPTTDNQVRIGTPANMRTGVYELHFHNDLFAAASDSVLISLGGATNMADLIIEIQLTDFDLNDGVRGGMTALANAAADGPGGHPISDAGGLDMDNLATKDDVAGIANVGAATAEPVVAAPGGFTLTTGSNEQNDEDSTRALDGTEHQWDDTAGAMDGRYLFNIGGAFAPAGAGLTLVGRLNGTVGDELAVNVNTGTVAAPVWEQRGSLIRQGSATNFTHLHTLFVDDIMTGVDAGKVQIQFTDVGGVTGATLSVDQIFVSKTSIADPTGYVDGAIWYDDTASNTNTVLEIDGTARQPVSSWTAVKTLLSTSGYKKVHVANGSTAALDANSDNLTLFGDAWTLQLGDQSIDGFHATGASSVTGSASNGATQPEFHNCCLGVVTMPPCHLKKCGIGLNGGTFTAESAGDYIFDECYSEVPGDGMVDLDFSGLGSATGVNNRGCKGGFSYTVDGDCTVSHEVVVGGIAEFISSGADIEIRGICRAVTLTLSAGGTNPNIQFVGVTGPITISGTATATTTVNLFGVSSSLADTSTGTVVNDKTTSRTNLNGGDWSLDTDSNGRMRVVDGTGAGEINTNAGAIVLVETTTTNTDMRGTDGANTTVPDAAGTAAGLHATTDSLITGLNDISSANVLTQVTAGLVALNLDHLMFTPVANNANMTVEVADGTVLSNVMSATSDTSTYVVSTDSLQAIRDFAAGIGNDVSRLVDDLPVHPTRATALSNLQFPMIDSTDHVSGLAGLTVAAEVSKDGGAFVGATNSVAEIGGGVYKFSATAAEMTADTVSFRFNATGADTRWITFLTQPT